LWKTFRKTGAKLTVEGSIEGLNPQGIFLLAVVTGLASTLRAGLGQRRSGRVNFLKQENKKGTTRQISSEETI